MKAFLSTIELFAHSSFYYIICTGMDGNYSYVNDNYAHRFNYIADNLIGMPYYITMHPDDMKVCEETAKKCFDHPGRAFAAAIRKHDGKGGYIITQWDYIAGFTETGEPEGIFCMGHDVTELDKKTERLKQIAFEQSHVVRKPLANILGIADIMSRMEMEESLHNLVDMMIENAEELDTVIREIVNKTHK